MACARTGAGRIRAWPASGLQAKTLAVTTTDTGSSQTAVFPGAVAPPCTMPVWIWLNGFHCHAVLAPAGNHACGAPKKAIPRQALYNCFRFHCKSAASLRKLYAQLWPVTSHPYAWQRYPAQNQTCRGDVISDLFYLSFGLAGFALAALAVRAIDRMRFMTFDIVLGLAVSAGIFGFGADSPKQV